MSYNKKDKKGYSDVELPTNPNLPSWIITPKEEKAIFERWRKKTFAKCDDLIKKYIECSNAFKNPIEAIEKCSAINQKSLKCVEQYQTQECLDQERDIYIKEKIMKKKIYRAKLKELEQEKLGKEI
ncbi:hypothetical protein KGF54_004524 [Candida jiufengensis]|uniref:uncharacterized protein n=1 Tax=Candida jiufengensis TaxID=497108 RepID=UPI0022256F4E|nr:uncharacterized protein KGF54_004524 [Candida jiufengensis]KAI5951450.1 hypothetical protein KGF54_004524 [Candida jiufengensis]